MTKRQPSLKWPLIVKPLIFHLIALLIAFFVLLLVLVRLDSGGHYTVQTFTKVAADAVVRNRDGQLSVQMTPALAEVLGVAPAAWFVAEDGQGRHVRFGEVPTEYASLMSRLGGITYGDLRGSTASNRLAVAVRQESGPAGALTVMGHGEVTTLTLRLALAANIIVIPIFALLATVSIILIPLIVRRSLAGVARIADEARQIAVNQRGIRLTETAVPVEIAPLVRAVNDALGRLDEGYERQRRFIAAAAHELRTPIAILRIKVDAAGEPAYRLSAEVERLSTLAEQLLDLHRLDQEGPMEPIDLASLVRRVAADLAPLLIAAGKEIGVSVDRHDAILGNVGALERVVSNLIQNAMEHARRNVLIRVYDNGFEVEDDGPGIPPDARERVFEPFQRLQPRQTGAGLGLNLVRQVIDRHRGRVSILDAPDGGAVIRVELPRAESAGGQGSRNVARPT